MVRKLYHMIRPYLMMFAFAFISYETWLWYDVPFYHTLIGLMYVYYFGWNGGAGFMIRERENRR